MEMREYRRALGSFPTGVTIVTAFDAEKQPWGLTANSFTSVSLEPPIVSVCVGKSGRVFPTLRASRHFAINILSADQQALALHFASNVENRFTRTEWTAGEAAPLLPGASAHLECSVQERIDAGDHQILLGRVLSYAHHPVAALVYCRGTFFAAPQPESLP